ncbi:MAG: metallophosphoesterase family protein [Hyphomicrobiales bacterium]
MKILAFSDAHSNESFLQQIVEQAEFADVVVGAGDFAVKGGSAAHMLKKLADISVPVMIVSGNHDNLFELMRLSENIENINLLHGNGLNIDGVEFYGLGCEVPQRNTENWNEWLSEPAATKMLIDSPKKCVLITHSPAMGHCDLQIYGANEGSDAVLACIENKQPVLHLCGHIHNAWGVSSKIGNTPTHNLGPSVNWFEI